MLRVIITTQNESIILESFKPCQIESAYKSAQTYEKILKDIGDITLELNNPKNTRIDLSKKQKSQAQHAQTTSFINC